MCFDLSKYDPFECYADVNEAGEEWFYDEPMTDDDWMEWLEND